MMANHEGSSGHNTPSKRVSSAAVKWTLVEAEPETPEGRRSKHQGYGRSRGQTGGGSSGHGGGWRSARDGGRGRGGGHHFSHGHRGRRGGGTRSNQGHGRGRGYAACNYSGATYYATYDGSLDPSYEQQKAYMMNMAVRQIEFYFTVENLCRDIFMRSYMDEEGYIPIAFVANFPGVARFGVELQDIMAGVLASETLQVDVENETMRMREGWKVWLLPNQATGRQGVPRYIKVDPSSISEAPTGGAGLEESAVHSMHDVGATECNETNVEANGARVRAGETTEAEHGQTANESSEVASHSEGEEETENSPSPASAVKKTTGVSRRVGGKRALTPTAPAWTPSGACKGSAEEQTPGPVDSIHAIVEDHISGSMRSDNSEVATETPMEHDSMPEHLKESDPAPQDSKGSEPTSQDPKKIDVAPEVPNGNDSTPQESKESDSMPPHSPDDPQDERNIEGVLCKNGPKTISSESSA